MKPAKVSTAPEPVQHRNDGWVAHCVSPVADGQRCHLLKWHSTRGADFQLANRELPHEHRKVAP